MMYLSSKNKGFSLIEIAVVVSLIGIFSMVAYSSFSNAKAQSRDKTRLASLQQLQLALELYKDKNGRYPEAGCSRGTGWVGPGPHPAAWGNTTDCPVYIEGLVPEFMAALPRDPKDEMLNGAGFLYKVSTDGSAYKALVHITVETNLVNGYSNEFARCPGLVPLTTYCADVPQNNVYAIYSAGAETW